MTKKVYRTAMGKTVDIGALVLQNENVRAVGNMSVNARGDLLDSHNRVIDKKSHQVQRQYRKQTNVNPPARNLKEEFPDLPEDNDVEVEKSADPIQTASSSQPAGGIAGAMQRAQTGRNNSNQS